MARLTRLSVPGFLHHVLQRGNNRQPIFLHPDDYQRMQDLLREYAREFSVAVHAYVLMDNHMHLLLTPSTPEGLSRMMQAVGRRYVRYFNDRHGRSGALWEGRYKSTVLESGIYLLNAMAYLDLNPVRAGLVTQVRDYPWSSYGHYAGTRVDPLVAPHPLYWSLGNTPFAREAAYAQRVQAGLSAGDQQELTDAALHGWALGGEAFLAEVQKHTARRLTRATPGRPPKKSSVQPSSA